MSDRVITIDFEDPRHQRLLSSAIHDPGHYVPRADNYRETLPNWQMRAINEAFDPSPPLYIQAENGRVAEIFANEHSLGHRNRHWFLADPDTLRGRSKIRLIRGPGWGLARQAEQIEGVLKLIDVEVLGE